MGLSADVINDFFGGETIFILGGNTLTIVGRNIADLSAGDFDFSGTPPASEPLDNSDDLQRM